MSGPISAASVAQHLPKRKGARCIRKKGLDTLRETSQPVHMYGHPYQSSVHLSRPNCSLCSPGSSSLRCDGYQGPGHCRLRLSHLGWSYQLSILWIVTTSHLVEWLGSFHKPRVRHQELNMQLDCFRTQLRSWNVEMPGIRHLPSEMFC